MVWELSAAAELNARNEEMDAEPVQKELEPSEV